MNVSSVTRLVRRRAMRNRLDRIGQQIDEGLGPVGRNERSPAEAHRSVGRALLVTRAPGRELERELQRGVNIEELRCATVHPSESIEGPR